MISIRHNLRQLLNYNYCTIIDGIKIMEKRHKYLYNSVLRQKYGESKYSYQGKLLCGEACFVTKYILERRGYQVSVWSNGYGYGKYYMDHCFLYIKDLNVIIDPTYRQLLNEDREMSPNSQYNMVLYKKMPPFFIGTPLDLDDNLNVLNYLNEKLYGTSSINDISKFWKFTNNITSKFDLNNCVNDKKYLDSKPDYYRDMVDLVKHL